VTAPQSVEVTATAILQVGNENGFS